MYRVEDPAAKTAKHESEMDALSHGVEHGWLRLVLAGWGLPFNSQLGRAKFSSGIYRPVPG